MHDEVLTYHFVLRDNSQGASFFRIILPMWIIEGQGKKYLLKKS
jgi:hypothetical protein